MVVGTSRGECGVHPTFRFVLMDDNSLSRFGKEQIIIIHDQYMPILHLTIFPPARALEPFMLS